MSKQNNLNFTLYQFLIFIILVSTSGLVIIELHQKNQIERSRFSYDVNKDFLRDTVLNQMSIDIDQSKPILKENGGRWNQYQLDDYLGFYELLSDYIDAKSIDLRDVYDFYGVPILQAYSNKEVQAYLNKSKSEDIEYYEKFEKLAERFVTINTGRK